MLPAAHEIHGSCPKYEARRAIAGHDREAPSYVLHPRTLSATHSSHLDVQTCKRTMCADKAQ